MISVIAAVISTMMTTVRKAWIDRVVHVLLIAWGAIGQLA
jgi:phage-related protein